MDLDTLTAEMAARGVTPYVKDGVLRLLPKGVLQTLPVEMRAALVAHKDALLAALTAPAVGERDKALIGRIEDHLWGLYVALRAMVAEAKADDAADVDRAVLGALDADPEVMALVEAEVAKMERGAPDDLRRVCHLLARDRVGRDLAGAALLSAHRRWTERLTAAGGDAHMHRVAMRLMRLELKIVTGKVTPGGKTGKRGKAA